MTDAQTLINVETKTDLDKAETDRLDLKTLAALELPDSDGEPMGNDRERIQINLALESLYQHWSERTDFFAGGNIFVYYSLPQAQAVLEELETSGQPRRAFRGPDMFVVLHVDGSYRRQKWVVWQEDGRYPNIIFEFLSPKTRHVDLEEKKALYEQTFGTREYFCFDYLNPQTAQSLLGWRLDEQGRYQSITANEQGWLWSEMLQLWVGRWSGTILRDKTTWLRFYTTEGQLVPTPVEAEHQRAEAAEATLARLQAQLAKQGIELD
jgi:Uma2 family endonuclease